MNSRSNRGRKILVVKKAIKRFRLCIALFILFTCGCVSQRVNIPFPTLGGKQFWADEFVCQGWRIQTNTLTGHSRLLDGADIRRGWGSYQQCYAVFIEKAGATALAPPAGELVVFVHGFIRAKDSLIQLDRAFAKRGYRTARVNYPSTQQDLKEHADQLGRVLDKMVGVSKVHFVTHSMGGLVIRQLLANNDDHAWKQRMDVGRTCMLFPPNQGSYLADLLCKWKIVRSLGGPAIESLGTQGVKQVPEMTTALGVIAGGKGDGKGRSSIVPGDDDGTVAVSETFLAGMDDHIVLDAEHTFGMNDRQVVEAAVRFIQSGKF